MQIELRCWHAWWSILFTGICLQILSNCWKHYFDFLNLWFHAHNSKSYRAKKEITKECILCSFVFRNEKERETLNNILFKNANRGDETIKKFNEKILKKLSLMVISPRKIEKGHLERLALFFSYPGYWLCGGLFLIILKDTRIDIHMMNTVSRNAFCNKNKN